MSFFKNAAPQDINLGAVDMSIKSTPIKPLVIPTHIPLCFTYSPSGPIGKTLVDGGRALALYGSKTFDRTEPYFNHATRLAEIVMGAGNAVEMVRIIPNDNDTISNTTIYADVLQDTVDVYKRNADGSFALDGNGDKTVDVSVTGYRLKVIAEVNTDDITTEMGMKQSKTGYMTDADGNPSTLIPLVELRAAYKGLDFNNLGITLNVPTNDNLNTNILEGTLSLPYELGIIKRDNINATGVFKNNMNATPFVQFAFKENGRDALTGRPVDFLDAMGTWYNLTDPMKDTVYPDFAESHVYRDNFETLVNNLHVAETAYVNADVTIADGSVVNTSTWLDFVDTVAVDLQAGINNVFTAKSTKNVPAFTYFIDDTVVTLAANHKEVYASKHTPVYLGGGKDGTLDKANFNLGVKEFMAKYLDRNSDVMDPAIDLENVLYDSGFDLDIKNELVNFITVRKNTFLALGTHIDNSNKYVTLDEHRAVGITLKARLDLAPESTFANTSVARGIIIVGSGIDSKDPLAKRYTLTMDLAYKAARMMGGIKWNKNLIFDSGGKNIITNYSDIEPARVPKGIIADLWNVGLNWPEHYDLETSFFPAMQSVYDNDTSVLNNFYAGMALTVDNNIASSVWRKYSGTTSMKNDEFIDTVTKEMNRKLNGVFDGVITASAKAVITDFDEQLGFSYTIVSKLSGNVMKTVQTHYAEVYNNSAI